MTTASLGRRPPLPDRFSVSQQALEQMVAAEASQIQELQRQLAAANQRIEQILAVRTFGEDFRALAKEEAVDHTRIAIDALKGAQEQHAANARQSSSRV